MKRLRDIDEKLALLARFIRNDNECNGRRLECEKEREILFSLLLL